VGLVCTAGVAAGFPRTFEEREAIQESLRAMPRWDHLRWLAKRGLPDPYLRGRTPVQDSGLRCVARWSYGPSTWVDIRATPNDTVVFLSRGSGVSIIRFRGQDSLRLDLLADINSRSLTGRCQVRDTLLYVNSGGVECYNVSDLSHPDLLNWLSQPLIYDFFVVDTLLYTSSRDSFRVFSVANPANPRRLGACADSGFVMYVSGNHAYLGHQAGLFILDVTNPAAPHRISSLGYDVLSISVRDTLLYFGTTEFALHVYNVKDPTTPFPVGSLSNIEAHDIYLPPTCDTVLYTPKLHVINTVDPANPRQIGFVDCPGWDYGVAAVPALNYVLVADYFKGMVAVNVANPTAPVLDTMAFAGDQALDITIDNGKAYLASYHAGLQILDVSDPTKPSYLGCYDTAGASKNVTSATAHDSFAFASWNVPRMLVIDVTDPRHPMRVRGWDSVPTLPQDMVLRDTFLYIAGRLRFNVVNVARPREPVLVGSCVSMDGVRFGLAVRDTFAYEVADAFNVINISLPDSPRVVTTISRGSTNLSVLDTLIVCAPGPIVWYSLANPAVPVPIDSIDMGHWVTGVTAANRTIYACSGPSYSTLYAISIADLHQPRVIDQTSLPYTARRVTYVAPYVYAAMWEAGVAIYETTAAGVAERELTVQPGCGRLRAVPNPASNRLRITGAARAAPVVVYDAVGRNVGIEAARNKGGTVELNMAGLRSGVYFVEVGENPRTEVLRVVRP